MKTDTDVTKRMVEAMLALRETPLPQDVLQRGKECLLDFLGVALGAADHPMVGKLCAVAGAMQSAPQATILWRSERTDALWAALINGSMAHILDFDDTHTPTILHGYAAVLAAGLALTETLPEPVTGRRFLHALTAGYETSARVALSVHPSHYDRGWHVSGTAGTFGAAAACADLLGLDHGQTVHALGMAATEAAGLREMFGSMAKPLHVGKAAQNGLLAALLAERGVTASPRSLEAPRGFCAVMADAHDTERLLSGWGSQWEILAAGFKPYPCGVVTHPGIEAMLALRAGHGLTPEKTAQVRARCHPLVLELTGKTAPATGLEGKFSIYHCLAAALADGTVGPATFTDERVRDPALGELRERIAVRTDAALAPDQAEVTVRLDTGEEVTLFIAHAAGTPEKPLSDAQLTRKFLDLAAGRLEARAAGDIQRQASCLEELADMRSLLPALGEAVAA